MFTCGLVHRILLNQASEHKLTENISSCTGPDLGGREGQGEGCERPQPPHSRISGVAFAGVARLPSGLLKKWPSPEIMTVRARIHCTCAAAWVSLGCVRATMHVQIDLSLDT